MLFFNKIFEGLKWLQASCLLLWRHKKLLSYKLFSIALKFVSMHESTLVLLFMLFFIKYFLDIALSGCTLQIVKGKGCSLVASLSFGFQNMIQLVWWTGFWILFKFWGPQVGFSSIIIECGSALIMLFVTFYLFPILASQQLSLSKALYVSIKLVKKTWIQIVAATALLWPLAKIVSMVAFSASCPLIFVAWVFESILMTLIIIVRTVAYSSQMPLH